MPNKKLDLKVAKDLWTEKPLSYKHLTIFGCEAYCHVSKHILDKLAPKLKKCIFIGYDKHEKMGFWLWDLESKKILCSSSNDIFFNEEKMHKRPMMIVKTCRVVSQEDVALDYGQNSA